MYVHSAALGNDYDRELITFHRIANTPKLHPGRTAVRTLLDRFDLDGPNGRHRCLVHEALWENAKNIRNGNEISRLPVSIVAMILKRVFNALTLLHDECHVAHTDIREANIIFQAESAVFEKLEHDELAEPSPWKEVDGHPVHSFQGFYIPKDSGYPVLCDFGSTVPLDDGREHREDIQSKIYRAPEILLDIPWTYSADIWNVGCVVSARRSRNLRQAR